MNIKTIQDVSNSHNQNYEFSIINGIEFSSSAHVHCEVHHLSVLLGDSSACCILCAFSCVFMTS